MLPAQSENGLAVRFRAPSYQAELTKYTQEFHAARCYIDKNEVGMNRDRAQERRRSLKLPTNKATILSVNADTAPNTFRVSLQWQGNFEIWDFDLQRFGKVLQIQDETANSGWVVIERSFRVPVAHALPGSALAESTPPLSPGDTIPLRPDLEPRLHRERTSSKRAEGS